MASAAAGRQSPDLVRPNLSDLRIVLLGKNGSANRRVGNTILGTTAFDSEAQSSSQQHSERISGDMEERKVTVINTHLIQTHLSQQQITQGNNTVRDLISECGGRHLQFDSGNPEWRSELFRRTEEILRKEREEFLICNKNEDVGEGLSVDEDQSRSGGSVRGDKKAKKDSDLKEGTKSASDGEVTAGKAKLNIVLCGNNSALKSSVYSKVFQRGGTIHGRQISVIELPVLTRLSEEEVMRETLRCVSRCDPGVHVFILVTPVSPLTDEERAEMEKIKKIFYSQEHFMLLFITELTVDQSVIDFVESTETQRIVSLYGSWYDVMGLKDQRNSEKILKILDVMESMETKPYSLQMYLRAPEKRVRHELEEKLSVKDNEIKELQKKIKTLEGVKLNLVVCGSDKELKSFISKLILNQSERRSELSSECVRRDVELHGRLISLVELPALFNTQLSEEEVMRQTHRCVSLCHPGVHVFIIIIPDAPLNNEDRAEIEKIQRIFSSRINKHIMILIKQNSEHQTAELNEETQSVIERFGGRHQFIDLNTQVSVLMEKLEQMVEENSGVCFSTETLLETQMEKLLKFEEMKKRIHSLEFQSPDSREDGLRIVLLGKTGEPLMVCTQTMRMFENLAVWEDRKWKVCHRKHYPRKQMSFTVKPEDEERRVEKRKRWEKMEDLKQEQEEKIRRKKKRGEKE
ncbi:hypothetical protein Q8A67_005535 [Cirrhinus molitorella]|uniref:AIG1-type G domain-containing protein n=1 Tax=Cirrhinus molitorella TaxID=172907 RepID=A0AA88TVH5_9TELE|nr:hypothetical protein Q8A67_005535 [Cirrhinus molitorella]